MSILKKLAGETLFYGIGYILPRILNYLLIAVYLTWKFDGRQEQYGLYTDFYFYIALLLVLLTLRMETTFFRFGSKEDTKKEAFSLAAITLIGTAGLWTLLVILFRKQMAAALQYPGYETHILILGCILTLDVLTAIPYASLRLESRPVRFGILKLTGVLVNIIAVLFFLEACPWMLRNGWDWVHLFYRPGHDLLYVFVANLMASFVVLIALAPKYFSVAWTWNGRTWKRMLAYTLPLVIVGLAGVINQSSYITFQKHILPNTITQNLSDGGVYAAATKLAILMNLFTIAFNYAAEPFFFQHAHRADAKQTYADVSRAFSLVASLIFVGILLYIDVIQLILGQSFRAGLSVVPILLMAFLLLGLYYNFSIWYKLTDRTTYGAVISAGGALITVALNILLIRELEVVGSAWAALACYGSMALACYVIGRRFYPVPYPIGRISIHLLAALGTYGLSEYARSLLPENTFLVIAVNTVLILLFVAVMIVYEKSFILSVIRPEK